MIVRTELIEITLSPAELAQEFTDMDNEQQALFFNAVGTLFNQANRSFSGQIKYVVDSPTLTNAGRRIMHSIGEYVMVNIT